MDLFLYKQRKIIRFINNDTDILKVFEVLQTDVYLRPILINKKGLLYRKKYLFI